MRRDFRSRFKIAPWMSSIHGASFSQNPTPHRQRLQFLALGLRGCRLRPTGRTEATGDAVGHDAAGGAAGGQVREEVLNPRVIRVARGRDAVLASAGRHAANARTDPRL